MLSRSELIALARKYRTLSALRRSQYSSSPEQARWPLRVLSGEFPGALRELDSLPLDEIERRADVLSRAAEDGQTEAWMEWMHEYHLTMRAALAVRRRLRGRHDLAERDALEIADQTNAESGWPCDSEFVRAVAQPPEGRVNLVVFQRVAAKFGQTRALIVHTLFPERQQGR